MGTVGVVFFLVVLTLGTFQTADSSPGCNCTRLHPQQHYCQANYVIRGRVLLLRWELIPDIHTDEPSTIDDTTTVTVPPTPTTMSPNFTEPMATKTNGTILAESNFTINPNSSHQSQSPDLRAMPARRRGNMLRKNRIINQEPWNYQIIYTIVTQDVFKTESSLRKQQELELISAYPGDGFCGVELKAGKSYILAGAEEGHITGCDWKQEYRKVTKLQKRGLKNNYGQSCDKCQIETCSSPECSTDLAPTTCAYFPPEDDDDDQLGYQSDDCTAKYQQCYPRDKKSNKCKWTSSKDSRSCSRKKTRGNA